MKWNKDEVFGIVRTILGENIDGVFMSYDQVENNDTDLIYTDTDFTFSVEATEDIGFAAGCTRICLIPKDKDYVIKIPVTGLYGDPDMEYGYENLEDCEIISTVNLEEYNVFDKEQAIYDSLLSESKDVFLPSIFVGEYCGIPIYIQEKVAKKEANMMSFSLSEAAATSVKKVVSEHKYDEFVDKPLYNDFIWSMITFYGEEATGFILEDCKNIDDLHSNNYGYLKDGRPVIFDFAGYDDKMYA